MRDRPGWPAADMPVGIEIMCSIVLLLRPDHDWPVLIAANRDEMIDRSWSAPARHWPDRPEVVAGKDNLAGGSWLGLNEAGLVVGMLNRRNTLGPQDGKRSRGELVLDALDFSDAVDAVEESSDDTAMPPACVPSAESPENICCSAAIRLVMSSTTLIAVPPPSRARAAATTPGHLAGVRW